MMKFLLSPRSILSLSFISILFIAGCNVKGFFVHLGDDPVFVDPDAKKQVEAGGTATSGGPGAAVFSKICATCHQGNGKGLPGTYPPLAGSEFATGESTRPIRIVLHGFKGKIVRGGKEYNGLMAPWKDSMTDQEIADVLTYVRSNWGNSAPAVTPDEVKAVREKTASRMKGWDESELQSPM
ncbi:MAG: cytochrome c [Bacteroidetes bacterium]|nr:cytochrome c [Bacteroidota bacterium]